MYEQILEVVDSVDKYVSAFSIDDSGFPYFTSAITFIAVEYLFHTYLDIRQRNVRPDIALCPIGSIVVI